VYRQLASPDPIDRVVYSLDISLSRSEQKIPKLGRSNEAVSYAEEIGSIADGLESIREHVLKRRCIDNVSLHCVVPCRYGLDFIVSPSAASQPILTDSRQSALNPHVILLPSLPLNSGNPFRHVDNPCLDCTPSFRW